MSLFLLKHRAVLQVLLRKKLEANKVQSEVPKVDQSQLELCRIFCAQKELELPKFILYQDKLEKT